MIYTYTDYEDFLSQVRPHCNGVPDNVAIDAVRNAVIEFLELSHWLISSLTPQQGVANLATYPIVIPNGYDIVRLVSLSYDNFPLQPRSEDQLRALYPYLDWRSLSGLPNYYLRNEDDWSQVTVVPTPQLTEANALTGVVALKPTRDSTGVDTSVYTRWLEQIAAGARSRLMLMPGQSFTNPRLAAVHDQKFRKGVADAAIDRNRTLERVNLVARPPRFI